MLKYVGIIYHNANIILKLTNVTKNLTPAQNIQYRFNIRIIMGKPYIAQELF